MEKLKKKYIGDREFYRRYIFLAVPMIVQSAITNFVSFLDNIMVGQLGTEQMTGVAIVNQLHFVFALALFGTVSAAGIFGAQYYGKGDDTGHMYTFRFRLFAALLVVLIAIGIFSFGGANLINLYLHEESSTGNVALAHQMAMDYMWIILVGMIPFALTQAYASIIKETGQTFIPMVAGLSGVISNAFLDWVLIFGIGPIPSLGVRGAALATVMARFIECSIVLIWTHTHASINRFLKGAFTGFGMPTDLLKQIIIKGAPLAANEVIWAAGITTLNQNYAIRGMEVVAAINISNTINNLFNIVFIQLGACISIIVGQYLGAGDMKKAKDADNKMIAFSVFCCTITAALMLALGKFFPMIYNTTDDIKLLATEFIVVQALVMPFCSFSHASYFTLRSGGKTIVTFLFDSVFTWVVMVTTAYMLTHFTALGIVPIFAIVSFTELIKVVVGYVMIKSNVWLVQMV